MNGRKWLAIALFLIRDRAIATAQDAPPGSLKRHLATYLAVRLPPL